LARSQQDEGGGKDGAGNETSEAMVHAMAMEKKAAVTKGRV
jgi:hypothetical protein